jgi:hypothetical protein
MMPVTALGIAAGRMFCGLLKVIVNGFDAACVSTLVCVPPKAVTAHCFEYAFGGVSATMVYVGDVSPVWAAPVTGEVKATVMDFSSAKERKMIE